MQLFNSIKSFFFARYVNFVEFVTLYMLAQTTKLVRKLLVLKGKDPNYVPPVKTTQEYDSVKSIQKVIDSHNSSWRGTNHTDASWVKNPNKHPVLIDRKKFESIRTLPVVNRAEPTQEVLQVTLAQEPNKEEVNETK